MSGKKRSHCKFGHKLTPKNSAWQKNYNGRSERKCKRCLNLRRQLRYKFDEDYRNKMLAKSRKYKEDLNEKRGKNNLQSNSNNGSVSSNNVPYES
jgi:hypothetical protein